MLDLKNFLKTKGSSDNFEYDVNFASIHRRFFASIIDIIILSMCLSCVFIPIHIREEKKALNSYVSNEIVITNNKQEQNDENIISLNNNINIVATEGQTIDLVNTSKEPSEKQKKEIKLSVLKKNFMIYSIIVSIVYMIYFMIFLLIKKQATLGQQLFNLKVIKKNGNRIDFSTALNRVVLFIMTNNFLIIPFAAILPMLLSKEKTTLYDLFSKTRVIEITKKYKNESNSNYIS